MVRRYFLRTVFAFLTFILLVGTLAGCAAFLEDYQFSPIGTSQTNY